jgi:hypothetical protein
MTEQIQEQDPAVVEEQGGSSPQLQISDLVKILEILNVVSARGAIKPDEFSVVGGIYERIYQFLLSSGVLKPGDRADDTDDAAPAAESTDAAAAE